MRIIGKDVLEKSWLQEILIFSTLFVLHTLNDWTLITSWRILWTGISYFGILYLHAFVHRQFLLPILLDRHRPVPYFLSGIGLILIFAAILSMAKGYLFPECYLVNRSNAPQTYVFNIATCTVSLIAIMAPFLLLRFYRMQKQQSAAQLCMNMVELNSLRSQLNPHFLFNTFNNLYGISLKEPARIPDLIMQVSQLMRYQLDNFCKQWVPLEEELDFIESCISLEEERVGRRCEIIYDYKNDNPQIRCQIAPMILITYIENAFKHGTNSIDACFVHINIEVKNQVLSMTVSNSLPRSRASTSPSIGIGLPNTEQRLNILYPDKHSLNRHMNSKEYTVDLVIDLS